MRIGILRGSFDPPHYGHLFNAVYALKSLQLDRIDISPVCHHPFGKVLTDWDHRVNMIEEMFMDFGPKVNVSVLDYHNMTGHTIDLLKLYYEYFSDLFTTLVMIGGEDTTANNSKHKDVEEILKLCEIAVVPRAMYSKDPYAIPNYSSSQIKKHIQSGEWEDLAKMMPTTIIQYIKTNNLYKENSVVSQSK